MILKSYKGKTPKIHPSAWIAENAVIIGDVEIGEKTSLWYGVVIRGDCNFIRIGKGTNIQDGTIIHTETNNGPCIIGDHVTIGHGALVHGCVVGDHSLIGMGSSLLSYAHIGQWSLVAAKALVREHQTVPDKVVMAGIPAKEKGPVSEELMERMRQSAINYVQLGQDYLKGVRG